MPNATNTAFEWVEVQPYYEESSPDFLERLEPCGEMLRARQDGLPPRKRVHFLDFKAGIIQTGRKNRLSFRSPDSDQA